MMTRLLTLALLMALSVPAVAQKKKKGAAPLFKSPLITAQTNRYVAVYEVLSSMGLLTTEHLNLGVIRYDPAAYYDAVKNAPVVNVSPQGERLDRVLKSLGKQ